MGYEFRICSGSSGSAGLTNLGNLTTPLPAPECSYRPFAREVELCDGSSLGIGSPVVVWHWGILTKNQRDQLKQFCSGKSATVFVSTQIQDLAYDDFQAVMIWPDEEERRATRIIDLTIEFRGLEAL